MEVRAQLNNKPHVSVPNKLLIPKIDAIWCNLGYQLIAKHTIDLNPK